MINFDEDNIIRIFSNDQKVINDIYSSKNVLIDSIVKASNLNSNQVEFTEPSILMGAVENWYDIAIQFSTITSAGVISRLISEYILKNIKIEEKPKVESITVKIETRKISIRLSITWNEE
ncbi:MAG: hypothetical protein H6Q72_1407 [Firmicutes bacterium]|nr:hypothetical protein [Bacillota bacterium]